MPRAVLQQHAMLLRTRRLSCRERVAPVLVPGDEELIRGRSDEPGAATPTSHATVETS